MTEEKNTFMHSLDVNHTKLKTNYTTMSEIDNLIVSRESKTQIWLQIYKNMEPISTTCEPAVPDQRNSQMRLLTAPPHPATAFHNAEELQFHQFQS